MSPGNALKSDLCKKFESLETENSTLRARLKDLAGLVDSAKLNEYLKQKGVRKANVYIGKLKVYWNSFDKIKIR